MNTGLFVAAVVSTLIPAASSEQEAIARLEAHGAEVPKPWTVRFQNNSATDTDLEDLCELCKLSALTLKDGKFSDRALRTVSTFRGLSMLVLDNLEITDDGLSFLKSLTGLTCLQVKWCPNVTDVGIRGFSSLRKLRFLIIDHCPRVGPDVWKTFTELSHLELLELSGTNISDETLRHLASFTSLKQIHVASCRGITKEGLAALKRALPNCSVYP